MPIIRAAVELPHWIPLQVEMVIQAAYFMQVFLTGAGKITFWTESMILYGIPLLTRALPQHCTKSMQLCSCVRPHRP